MSKKVSSVACLIMASTCLLTACGTPIGSSQGGGSNRPEAIPIVIYAGGSSDFAWVKGSAEAEVIDHIEEKYFEETGTLLDFQAYFYGQDMHTKLDNELQGGSQIDIAISHTRGGQGIDDKRKGDKNHYNLYDVMEYAPNLYEAIKGAPLDCLTTAQNDIIGIPSVISPYKFGILVRKDYMEQCGYTDDPAKAETGAYELVDNLVTFEAMCKEMNEITGSTHAVTGAPWDLEKVVTMGAYTEAGYFSSAVSDCTGVNMVMAGFATPEYEDVLALEYKWAMEGVTSPAEGDWLIDQGEQNFVSGKTGVFVLDPTIQHLINVARRTKSANPEAEFTVLGALTKDKESTKKGFMRNPEATFGAVIMKQSENVNEIMAFLNWVYESEENYNLCRYGIEGKHWVNNQDGTYSFPADSKYTITSPAYSGILTLVENQRMSNLTYDGYSAEEMRWINEVAGNADNYVKNDVMDYLFTSTDDDNLVMAREMTNVYQRLALPAWQGIADPKAPAPSDKTKTFFRYTIDTYNSGVRNIQIDFTTQYNNMKAARGK